MNADSNPHRVYVIVPAYNEAADLSRTLQGICAAVRCLEERAGIHAELIVVDNASTDNTAGIAREHGAAVLSEPVCNIARARNAGARASAGEVLVFLDADTLIPESLLCRIAQAMADSRCAGGAVDIDHRASRRVVRAYLRFWRALGTLAGMAQGAAQFCRREMFVDLGGYDEALFMGEDVDFNWRLKRLAHQRGLRACFINDLRVTPSSRRFDQWPLWRILVWTNPVVILLFRRAKSFWPGWYHSPPR